MTLPTVHQSAAVHYRADILDAATGRVVSRGVRKRNLILDQGLDGIAARTWAGSFTHAVVGTGTTPTKRDSGAVTVSRTGNVLTASAGFFEAADVGRLWKFDTGEEVRITAFTDSTHVTTADSGNILAAEGTVWYVNQTGLTIETKRSNNYSTDSGANGSTYLAGIWTHKRTFIFSAEVGTVTYREVGWSHTATAGANLFGRDLLAGVGVTLVAGQQLRVTVELSVAYSPVVSTAQADIGTGGISSAGTCGIERIGVKCVGYVGSNGMNMDNNSVLEPSAPASTSEGACIGIYSDGSAIAPASPDRADPPAALIRLAGSRAAYASGTFRRVHTATASVSQANSTNIRSVSLDYFESSIGRADRAYRVRFDNPQTKTSAQTLRVEFTLSWGRVLDNS